MASDVVAWRETLKLGQKVSIAAWIRAFTACRPREWQRFTKLRTSYEAVKAALVCIECLRTSGTTFRAVSAHVTRGISWLEWLFGGSDGTAKSISIPVLRPHVRGNTYKCEYMCILFDRISLLTLSNMTLI